jgi:radical SAM superfamily enzyme YgiQ (UPF0313 family)
MRLKIIVPASPFLIDPLVFMPLGPLQVATAARDVRRWEVEVVDLDNPDAAPYDTDADVWGVFAKTCHVPQALEILKEIRHRYPDAYVVAGGPHANAAGQQLVDSGFDAAVAAQTGGGGGEPPLLHILQIIEEAGPPPRGVVALPLDDPDEWPHADRRLIDHAKYHYLIAGERAAHVVTQYGCPFDCAFCSSWPGYRRVRCRGYSHIRRELQHLSALGYRAVMNFSDELNVVRKHLLDWCRAVSEVGMVWRAFVHTGPLTEDDVRRMADAGCKALGAGVESGSDAILRVIRKRTTPEKNLTWVRWCAKRGIASKAFVIIGLPGETKETVEATRRWLAAAIDEGLQDFDVTVFTPLPGSPVVRDPEGWDVVFGGSPSGVYKTKPGNYVAAVGTAELAPSDIVCLRDDLEAEFKPRLQPR